MRTLCAGLAALGCLLPAASRADVLSELRERGSVRVAVAEGVPWLMGDAAGSPMGFSVDLAERLASDLRLRLELVVVPFSALVPAISDGRADVAAAGLPVTGQSALEVDFTSSLGTSRIELVAHLDPEGARYDLHALDREDAKIGFESGTLFELLARLRFPNAALSFFPNEAEARSALLEGSVQALIASEPLPELLARENPTKLFRPANATLYTTAQGLAVRRGEAAWLRVLDAWITEQKANGFLARTRSYWFGDTEWLGRLSQPLRETVGAAPAPAVP